MANDGLGTHTPIRFGQAIERARSFHLRDFSLADPLDNDRYLLYLLYKRISSHWHGFMLIQGARRAGKFTVEMGMSLHARYPLHNARVRPSFAVDGLRERAAGLINEEDQWWEYRNQDDLQNRLREVCDRVARSGFTHLYDTYASTLVRESKRAQDLITQYEAEDAKFIERPLGARYSSLMLEPRAYEYIEKAVRSPQMRAVLGDLRAKMLTDRWFSALVFVMASLLDTGDPNEMSQNIYVPNIVDDEGMTLCGRVPFYLYLDPADDYDERVNRYCFFKAVNIVESQIDTADRLNLQTGVLTTLRDEER